MKYSGWLFAVGLSFGGLACSAYDPSLVQQRGSATTAPAFAGRGSAGSAGHAGAAGFAGRGAAGSFAGSFAGAGGVAGAPIAGAPPVQPVARCGDGRVDSNEKCDTGIAANMPGACPIACTNPTTCQRMMLTGSGCQAECLLVPLECVKGDGCCPATCDAGQDPDCSGMCGDGIVQIDLLETCEVGSPTKPCPTAADCDDKDACTHDAVSGTAANCTAACTHTPITTPQAGDGCCPSGANSNTDSDCAPRCGNGVREGAESCDGSTGCSTACALTLSAGQVSCLEKLADTTCESCECMRCNAEMTACSASGNAQRDAACSAVEACAIAKGCAGMACYCGDAVWGADCAFRPNGPCKDVIESAAGTTLATRIDAQSKDPNSALGRAQALGTCRRAQCATDCK